MKKILLSVHWHKNYRLYDLGSGDDGASEIISWLSDDVTHVLSPSDKDLDFWIQKFNAVAHGEVEGGYLGSGNAHNVCAIGENIFLSCQYVEEMKVFLSREQMIDTLEKYKIFLSFDLTNQNSPPPGFEVEYIESGARAEELYLKTGGALGLNPDSYS